MVEEKGFSNLLAEKGNGMGRFEKDAARIQEKKWKKKVDWRN